MEERILLALGNLSRKLEHLDNKLSKRLDTLGERLSVLEERSAPGQGSLCYVCQDFAECLMEFTAISLLFFDVPLKQEFHWKWILLSRLASKSRRQLASNAENLLGL